MRKHGGTPFWHDKYVTLLWTPPNQVNPQQTGNKYALGRERGMEGVEDWEKAEDPEGHQDQEQADRELSNAEIQEICEAKLLAIGFPCYAYSIRQDTARYGRIRQDTAGYGRIRQ